MKTVTLLFLLDKERGQILLAMKKRGFGVGKLNGVGGKVQEGETVPRAAVREAHEEIGVTIREEDAVPVARLHFVFAEHPEWEFDCHVFTAEAWQGEPAESEEMAPQWHPTDAVPFDQMWIDDVHWLPRVLSGERLEAEFLFGGDGQSILEQHIVTVSP